MLYRSCFRPWEQVYGFWPRAPWRLLATALHGCSQLQHLATDGVEPLHLFPNQMSLLQITDRALVLGCQITELQMLEDKLLLLKRRLVGGGPVRKVEVVLLQAVDRSIQVLVDLIRGGPELFGCLRGGVV